jgi:hypothetical protein
MSTVDKTIADRVIAGEFPEDDVVAIIKYNNVFNGNEAYKLIFSRQASLIQWILDGKEANLLNPTIYWKQGD